MVSSLPFKPHHGIVSRFAAQGYTPGRLGHLVFL
jgi:hypothetical protein